MENSISTGTKVLPLTHHGRAGKRKTTTTAFDVSFRTISVDRVNNERGIGERNDASLEDPLPGGRPSNIVEPADQYRSTAPCLDFCRIGNRVPQVPLSCVIN